MMTFYTPKPKLTANLLNILTSRSLRTRNTTLRMVAFEYVFAVYAKFSCPSPEIVNQFHQIHFLILRSPIRITIPTNQRDRKKHIVHQLSFTHGKLQLNKKCCDATLRSMRNTQQTIEKSARAIRRQAYHICWLVYSIVWQFAWIDSRLFKSSKKRTGKAESLMVREAI